MLSNGGRGFSLCRQIYGSCCRIGHSACGDTHAGSRSCHAERWVTVGGDCSRGQHLLSANGKYKVWCFDSTSEGEWSLRDGNKIIVRLDPKTSDGEIIIVVRVEGYSDHTVLDVRYQNGTREQWMK
jgi:hypothetical protein